ncbi:MAG: phosphoribosyltransferase family protein [Bacillota bacterium]
MRNRFWHVLLNLLYPVPQACPICGRKNCRQTGFCDLCQGEIEEGKDKYQPCGSCGRLVEINHEMPLFVTRKEDILVTGVVKGGEPLSKLPFFCWECQREAPPFNLARAVGPYAGVLKDAVHLLKYNGRYGIARPLSQLMARAVLSEPAFGKLDLIVSVPLHPRRLRERTYNQAQLLAAELGVELGVPEISNILVKFRDTLAQVGLSRKERLQNISGSFRVSAPANVANLRVLLVDDIFTTGSTVTECARVLLEAGARTVSVITVATGLLDGSPKIPLRKVSLRDSSTISRR